jgi:ParB family chromosome partitioning protein
LGKGIEAIISNRPTDDIKGDFAQLRVEDIYANPFQPRKLFSSDKLRELADSIKESGLIQPIVVYQREDRYYLLVGERRWRAAQLLKWEKIPAIVKELTEDEVMIGALIENIQREDLNAIEVAEGIDALLQKTGLNQEAAAGKLGMSRTALTNLLRLLRLPDRIKEGIVSGEISPGHARPLLTLNDDSDRMSAFAKILHSKLSVRQTETLVKNFYKSSKATRKENQDPDIKRAEDRLMRSLATKVNLKYSSSGRGRIEIHFSDLGEFERLYKIFVKE